MMRDNVAYRVMPWIGCLVWASLGGCATDTQSDAPLGPTGYVSMSIITPGGVVVDEVTWLITGNGISPLSDILDTSGPGSAVSFTAQVPAGTGYIVLVTAVSADQQYDCAGSATFDLLAGQSTPVSVTLSCSRTGTIEVEGEFNLCPLIVGASPVSPQAIDVGDSVFISVEGFDTEGDPISYAWSGSGGTFDDPTAASTNYTCTMLGPHTVSVVLTDDGYNRCTSAWTTVIDCVDPDRCIDAATRCDDGNDCTVDSCDPVSGACLAAAVADSLQLFCPVGSTIGVCVGGYCKESDGPLVTKSVSLVCDDTFASGQAVELSYELSVDPYGAMYAGGSFDAVVSGVANIPGTLLDLMFGSSGFVDFGLYELQATVRPRYGATGPDVLLVPGPMPTYCVGGTEGTGTPCTVANEEADCGPGGRCIPFLTIPTIDGIPTEPNGCSTASFPAPLAHCDCTPCSSLSVDKGSQCSNFGKCVASGSISLPLEPVVTTYTASEDEVLLGWTEPAAPGWDETDLPIAENNNPAGPNGIRAVVRFPFGTDDFGLECVMGRNATSVFDAEALPDGEVVQLGKKWRAPSAVETDAGDARNPKIVVDTFGGAIAIWSQSDGTRLNLWSSEIRYNTWDTAELVESRDDNASAQQAVIDASGTVTVVWIQGDGTRLRVWANRRPRGGPWGTPRRIDTGAAPDPTEVRAVVAPSGEVTVSWADGSAANAIWSNRYVSGSGWGATAVPVGRTVRPSGASFAGEMAVDSTGLVTMVWQAGTGLWWSSHTPGSGWSTEATFATVDIVNSLDVTADTGGNVTAMWSSTVASPLSTSVYSSRLPLGGVWGSPEPIDSSATNPVVAQQAIAIEVEPDGTGVALWETDSAEIWASRRPPGGSWLASERISSPGVASFMPELAIDADGNATALWSTAESADYGILTNRHRNGRHWGGPELISNSLRPVGYPALAVDSGGGVSVVWEQEGFSGPTSIWANRFE